jgi:hypothetical protein
LPVTVQQHLLSAAYFNKLSVSMVLGDWIAYLRGPLDNMLLWFRQKQSQLLKCHCFLKIFRRWDKVQEKEAVLVSHKPLWTRHWNRGKVTSCMACGRDRRVHWVVKDGNV